MQVYRQRVVGFGPRCGYEIISHTCHSLPKWDAWRPSQCSFVQFSFLNFLWVLQLRQPTEGLMQAIASFPLAIPSVVIDIRSPSSNDRRHKSIFKAVTPCLGSREQLELSRILIQGHLLGISTLPLQIWGARSRRLHGAMERSDMASVGAAEGRSTWSCV